MKVRLGLVILLFAIGIVFGLIIGYNLAQAQQFPQQVESVLSEYLGGA